MYSHVSPPLGGDRCVLRRRLGSLRVMLIFLQQYADRHGRTSVMGISLIGLLITDVNFILIYYFFDQLPGGYWLLLIGPLIEGTLGGMLSAIAATNAYVADTTSPLTRYIMSIYLVVSPLNYVYSPDPELIHSAWVFYLSE